jgi:hypothetical protein
MSVQLKRSTWPVICIAGCLFVLSLAAPRAWEHAARRQTATETQEPVEVAEVAVIPAVATPSPERVQISPQPPVVPTQALVMPDENVATPEAQFAHPAEKIASHPVEFDDPSASSSVIDDESWTDETPSAPVEANVGDDPLPPTATALAPAGDESETNGPALLASIPRKSDPTPREPAQLMRLPAIENVTERPRLQRSDASDKDARWSTPTSLLERLKRLEALPSTAAWSKTARRQLERLTQTLNSPQPLDAERQFTQLRRQAEAGQKLADKLAAAQAGELRRAAHAMLRRVDVWNSALQAAGPGEHSTQATAVDPQRLALCLNNLKGIDGESPLSDAWRQYLLVDALQQLSQKHDAAAQEDARRLARQVLVRLTRTPVNERQRTLIESQSMAALRSELERWAAEPVELGALMEAVERFEQSGLASDGRELAEGQLRLSFSPVEAERQLARKLDSYYRNANSRIVISKTLLNRLVPEPKAEYEPVHETVLGYPVFGRSLNQPKLGVEFVPDRERLLMQFVVKGTVSSSTSSTAGPATFFNSGEAYYEARKLLEIDAGGIHLQPAEVTAYSNNRLRGLRTSFDPIPILGGIAQSIARAQHDQRKQEADAEVQWKITSRAQERIDQEAYSRVSNGVDRLRERVFVPLNELGLNPTMIEAQTTEERMTMRLRLATDSQLGSQTPRPRAPSDSLASVQLHETAINNLMERLELDGRTFTPEGLSKHVAQRLHRDAWPCNTDRDDATIRFAPQNAMSIRCQEGRVILTLAVAELRSASRSWKDFQIRVMYRPVIQGRSAELVRDGVVQLIGRLSTGSQLAVRGIFSKTFSKDSRWRVSPEWFANDERMADLAISQFAVEDGWLSVAYSPRPANAHRRLIDRHLR